MAKAFLLGAVVIALLLLPVILLIWDTFGDAAAVLK